MIDLNTPEGAYAFGFMQADGHLSREKNRNSGKLRIELNIRDEDILYKLQQVIPVKTTISTRVRDTNFKKNVTTITLTACDAGFREFLNNSGIPYGKKHLIIAPPNVPYSKVDYYRGLIDGDGSLGVSEKNRPFVSLNTSSKKLAEDYMFFIKSELNHDMGVNPNKRDFTYNLIVYDEIAQKYSNFLYYDGCLAMDRKIRCAAEISAWARTAKKRDHQVADWTVEEDLFIQMHPLDEAVKKLNRTEQSVKMRLWRLSKKPL